jgi:hypothetical protein
MANQPSQSASTPSASPTTPAPNTTAPSAETKAPVTPPVTVGKAPVVEDSWEVQENGKTIKKSRKEIIDAYQLRQLSDKKRSEADKTLSEYNKLFEVYKKDPIKFMRATGVDFDNLATSYLSKKAEDAMMDPKDRELREAKAEAEQYKKYVEEQKTNKERLDKEAAIGLERTRIHQEIIQAIEESKELGLPVDEELVIAIAQKMILQDKAQKPLNAKEALPKAYESTQKWLQGMASKMEGEKLVAWLGKDVAMKIRKYDLQQLKAKRAQTAPQSGSLVKPQSSKKVEGQKPYKTWSQFKSETLDNIK